MRIQSGQTGVPAGCKRVVAGAGLFLVPVLVLAGWLFHVGAGFAGQAGAAAPVAARSPTLRESAHGLFEMGVGISDRIPTQTNEHTLLLSQFEVVTPENCMKPAHVQPMEVGFNFGAGDAFVAFARQNGLAVCGHCLVWAKDDRTPEWFFKDAGKEASKELLLSRMQAHIKALVGRYRGQVAMWDVVNEALDDGDGFLRASGWERICGPGFLTAAFKAAREADPDALLIYNDYNNEAPAKREKMLRLARMLLQEGAPLHALGLQGHYEIDRVPFKDIEDTLIAIRGLGLKAVISELDIDVIPRSKWWAEGGKYRDELAKTDPYREGCPPEVLQRQAEQYGELFRIFRRHADVIARVSFWNLHDGQSWLNDFPWKRANHPLLFDRARKPKPAFYSVVAALENKPRVLIFNGQNNHDWRQTTPRLKSILEGSGRFSVEATEHPERLDPAALERYDVILSDWNTFGTPAVTNWPEALKSGLVEWFRKGKGFVVVHAGGSSFYDWPDYQKIAGGFWKMDQTSHGAPHKFTVKAVAAHPITEGLEPFATTDELWIKPGIHPDATVIATGDDQPVALVTSLGAGRGFTTLMGHSAEFTATPGFQALLLRGTEWAATGKVTIPFGAGK